MSEHQKTHVTEYFQYQKEQWSWSRVAQLGIAVATGAVLSISLVKDSQLWTKVAVGITGLGALQLTQIATGNSHERKRRLQDIVDMSNAGFTQELYETLVNPNRERPVIALPQAEETTYTPRLFNIYEIISAENYNKYPHIIVLGETGSGKTTLVSALMKLCRGKRFYVSPTREEDEFVGDFEYVGCGTQPHQNGDYDAITKFFKTSKDDVTARMKMSKAAKEYLGRREIAVDEVPLLARNTEGWADWFLHIVSAARKQGVRLWLLATGEQVKSLKLEGTSDMKANLSYLHLGRHALVELERLVNSGKYPRAALMWCGDQVALGKRVFVFEGQVGVLPDLYVPSPDVVDEENPFSLDSQEVDSLVVSTPPALDVDNALDKPESIESVEEVGVEISLTPEETALRARWRELQNLDPTLRKQRILFKTGFNGKRYKEGSALWDKLM